MNARAVGTPAAGEGTSVRTLERAIQVLWLLDANEGNSLAELHHASGLPKPTLLRILHTLEGGGLVWRAIGDGRWRRTAAWAAVQSEGTMDRRLTQFAAPHLVALQRKVLWPSDLLVYRDFAMEIAESSRRVSGLALNRRYRIGYRVDILLSAPGRAWLAFCAAAQRQEVLAHWRADALVNRRAAGLLGGEIDRILEETLAHGYAVRDALFGGSFEDISHFDDGFDAVAVPIIAEGEVRAAVNLVWPRRYGLRAKLVHTHLDDLKACAAGIAREITSLRGR